MHRYYIKERGIWDVQIPQASRVIQKNLKDKETLNDAGYDEVSMLQMKWSSIKSIYGKLRGDFQIVQWRLFMCNHLGAPKWCFILYLDIRSRFPIRNRLDWWMTVTDKKCPLCCNEDESLEHLLFYAHMQQLYEKN